MKVATGGLPVSDAELQALLVDELELLSSEEFEAAALAARRLRVPIERTLVERARVPAQFLFEELARQWGVTYVDLKIGDVRRQALASVPPDFAREHTLIPFERTSDGVRVAMRNPRDREVVQKLERIAGQKVLPCLAPEATIKRALLLYRPELMDMITRARQDPTAGVTARAGADPTPAEILTRLFEYAALTRASDLHIEPYEYEILVRCRIDGVLQDVMSVPASLLSGIATRVKVLAGMRVDEKRLAQDGRLQADLGGGLSIDLRVSSLPTMWGEKIVMRVLSRDDVVLELEHLGLVPLDYEIVLRHLLRPHGMVLVTGPTGSGKTTTLYAFLTRVGAERQNVINLSTIEDPIEYTIPRVNQVPVNHQTGLDFAAGLRALLRQDPDVLMVGEIRDRETADVAVRAALVGRLLFSTLHTNDATSAVPRLLDMGIEPYLLGSTLSLVVAQRLVRRLCTHCRESYVADEKTIAMLQQRDDFPQLMKGLQARGIRMSGDGSLKDLRLFRSKGCLHCQQTGYRGRFGIFELFEVKDKVKTLMIERRDAPLIRAAALDAGMRPLLVDGLAKVIMGDTSLEEVIRAAV